MRQQVSSQQGSAAGCEEAPETNGGTVSWELQLQADIGSDFDFDIDFDFELEN